MINYLQHSTYDHRILRINYLKGRNYKMMLKIIVFTIRDTVSRTYIKWLVNCSLLIIHDIMFQSHNLLILGPFTWRWGTPGRWGNPLRWGNPPFHTISHFILVMFTWWVRVTRQRGFLGLPSGVTLSARVTICHVNVSRWGNPPICRIHGKKLKS